MADSIVACPGCRKQYTVPGGVPPGQFQCQDCAAVVVYGQSGGASASSAKGGGGKRKKAARGRKEPEPEERGSGRARGGAPKKEGDPTPFILGIVAIAIVILIVVLMNQDETVAPTSTETAAKTSGSGSTLRSGDFAGTTPTEPVKKPEKPVNPLGDPDDLPAAKTVEEDPDALGPGARARKKPDAKEDAKYEAAANPPTGGNYGKDVDDLRALVKSNRAAIIGDLPHLPDTPPALASEIDTLVLKVADPYAGREALDASHRLVAIGRAAIPRLLSAAAAQDFSKFTNMMDARDPCVVADAVDTALRDITSKTNITKLQFNPQGTLAVYPRVIENWYIWWLNTGYERASFPKKAETPDDE
jgi:hypothetical protein